MDIWAGLPLHPSGWGDLEETEAPAPPHGPAPSGLGLFHRLLLLDHSLADHLNEDVSLMICSEGKGAMGFRWPEMFKKSVILNGYLKKNPGVILGYVIPVVKYVPSGLRVDKPIPQASRLGLGATLGKAENSEKQPKVASGAGYLEMRPAGGRWLSSSRKSVNLFHVHQRAAKANLKQAW